MPVATKLHIKDVYGVRHVFVSDTDKVTINCSIFSNYSEC